MLNFYFLWLWGEVIFTYFDSTKSFKPENISFRIEIQLSDVFLNEWTSNLHQMCQSSMVWGQYEGKNMQTCLTN